MLVNLRSLIGVICIGFVTARPQFITYKDGKLGVNFAGYHAEVGLGGLLTGNAAHGGLSASAGTPFGQQAGAGIGGSLTEGRAGGGAYAGAAAGYGVGASAAIGGGLDDSGAHGGTGTETHVFNNSKKAVLLSQAEGAGVESNLIEQNEQPRILRKKVIRKKYDGNQEKPELISTTTAAPAFDFGRFFDFGFFTNLAAGFGGPRPSSTVRPEKTLGEIEADSVAATTRQDVQQTSASIPRAVHQSVEATSVTPASSTPFLISLNEYNPEIVPHLIQKPISQVPTVELREPAPPQQQQQQQQQQEEEAPVLQQQQDALPKQSDSLQEFVETSRRPSNQRTLFDDIFNIPISAITAVNQFLNNRFQQG